MDKKSRNLMYVQQIQHLKKDINELPKILDKSGALKWAFIVHDKDESSTNKIFAEKHIHCALKFKNARYAGAVSKKIFDDKAERVQAWDKRDGNLWSYLIHDTEEASEDKSKYNYSPKDVTANFNYEAEIKKINKEVKYAKVKSVKPYLQDYAEGLITKSQLIKEIGLYNFANHKR